jgi:hypothetical protein
MMMMMFTEQLSDSVAALSQCKKACYTQPAESLSPQPFCSYGDTTRTTRPDLPRGPFYTQHIIMMILLCTKHTAATRLPTAPSDTRPAHTNNPLAGNNRHALVARSNNRMHRAAADVQPDASALQNVYGFF